MTLRPGWTHTRIKYESSLKGRLGWQGLKADEYRDEGPHVVSSAHFDAYEIRWDQCPRVSQERYDLDTNIQLRQGDVLLMKDGAAMGKLAYVDELPGPACLNSHLLLFRPIGGAYWPRFMFYVLDSKPFQEFIKVNGTGATFLGISQESVGNYDMNLPPLQTQKAIADSLDRKTADIDGLIQSKQKLLDLLAEKRAAIINQAVTKGLDPTVPMKESGIPWIGEIPAHWEAKKLSWLLQDGPRNGVSPPVVGGGTGVPSFSLSVVRGGAVEVREEDVKFVAASSSDVDRFGVKKDDLLLVRGNGNINLVGAVGLAASDLAGFVYPDLLMRMRCGTATDPSFLRYCINSEVVRPQLNAAARTTVGTYKVNNEQVRELRVLAPPKLEAARISNYLDEILQRHSAQSAKVQEQLERLREYRQALITASVTGQLDITSKAA